MNEHRVHEVANMLDVSPPTIRRWSKAFIAHLSDRANPGPGLERRFTDDDLRVLAYAARRFDVGVSAAAILAELPTASLPPLADVAGDKALTPADSLMSGFGVLLDSLAENTAATAQAAQQLASNTAIAENILRIDRDVADIRRQVEALTAAVEALQEQAHRHRWHGR